MDSCLRSNILTAVAVLLMAHGMSNMGISELYDMNDTLQTRVDALVTAVVQDSKDAAQAHRAAAAQLEEKKRQLEAQGCKL